MHGDDIRSDDDDPSEGGAGLDVSNDCLAAVGDVPALASQRGWGVRIGFADGQIVNLRGATLTDLDATGFIL